MVCLSQGVIQTSIVLGGTVSYFVASREVNSTVLGRNCYIEQSPGGWTAPKVKLS